MVIMPLISAVESMTPVPSIPASIIMPVWTTRTYAIVAKVVKPARISVRTLLPRSLMPKKLFLFCMVPYAPRRFFFDAI